MKVKVFRDLKEERWFSMDRYADEITKGCQSDSFVIPVSNKFPLNTLNLFYTRYVSYPKAARVSQGDVNHIADHSYGHLLYALDPKKTVITCHDLNPLKHEESWMSRRLFQYSINGLKKAAKIIADSNSTKDDLVRSLSIDPDDIRVLYLGVDKNFKIIEDSNEIEKTKSRYNLTAKNILLHVGGVGYNKNVEGIINALAKVRNETEDFLFVQVGADFSEAQKNLIQSLSIVEKVRSIGNVTEPDLVLFYNLADLLVFPSFYEGFGFPILESMACGTPVITSKASSMAEIAGDASILVDPRQHDSIASGIINLLRNKNIPSDLVDRGLRQAALFNWERTCRETSEVYREVYEQAKNITR